MKLAPWAAVAAIALMMSGSLLSHATAPPLLQPLDFTGIDTLVLESTSFDQITLGNLPGRMTAKFNGLPEGAVTRKDAVLTIKSESWLEIEAPATLRRIVGASDIGVADGVRVHDVLVEGDDRINWNGDVDRLRIVHRTKPETGSCRCPGDADRTVGSVTVASGHIGSLEILSERGKVSLDKVEDIGHATLELGKDAEYELGGLHGKPPEVTLVALPATPPTAPAKVAKPAPADSVAEPPRAR